jgi:hypothetical protein
MFATTSVSLGHIGQRAVRAEAWGVGFGSTRTALPISRAMSFASHHTAPHASQNSTFSPLSTESGAIVVSSHRGQGQMRAKSASVTPTSILHGFVQVRLLSARSAGRGPFQRGDGTRVLRIMEVKADGAPLGTLTRLDGDR